MYVRIDLIIPNVKSIYIWSHDASDHDDGCVTSVIKILSANFSTLHVMLSCNFFLLHCIQNKVFITLLFVLLAITITYDISTIAFYVHSYLKYKLFIMLPAV